MGIARVSDQSGDALFAQRQQVLKFALGAHQTIRFDVDGIHGTA